MTREEAIKMLKSKMDGHTDTSYEWAETVRMAIASLEAWEKVWQEINDLFSKPACYIPNYDAYKMFLEIIDRHLQKASLTGAENEVTRMKMTKERALDTIWMRCQHNDKTFEAYCVLKRELGLNELSYSENNPNKWIPVSEKLPKDNERVLVTKRMFHWANEPAEYSVGIESFSGNIDFVAWMPLPEPYKAESEEME